MGNCQFKVAVRILQLGGCDMVVGVDLLKQLGPMTFNFDDQSIKFTRRQTEVVLQGVKSDISLKMINGK